MKIIKVQTQEKDYNGIPYTEYKIYGLQNGNNVIVTCSGSVETLLIEEETGAVCASGPLKSLVLKAGDDIIVWRNESTGKVQQIDVYMKAEVPLS